LVGALFALTSPSYIYILLLLLLNLNIFYCNINHTATRARYQVPGYSNAVMTKRQEGDVL
jgi:hypothetical protein